MNPTTSAKELSYAPSVRTAASTKKISVFPKRSEAPAKDLEIEPLASILTMFGSGLEETMGLRVVACTVICCDPGRPSRLARTKVVARALYRLCRGH